MIISGKIFNNIYRIEKENEEHINIFKCSILDIKKYYPDVKCIVNAANIRMRGGGGLDGEVHRAAGGDLMNELKLVVPNPPVKVGEVIVTKGYKTGYDYIFHVAGPSFQNRELLEETYRNVLIKADQMNIGQIAIPPISAGIFGYPLKENSIVAINTARSEIKKMKSIEKIIFVLYTEEEYNAFYKTFNVSQ